MRLTTAHTNPHQINAVQSVENSSPLSLQQRKRNNTEMFVKRLSALILLIVYFACFLAGCTININVGNPVEDATKETDNKTIFDHIFNSRKEKTMYESRATILISNRATTDTAISSSDLVGHQRLVATYNNILQSRRIQDEIREEYPGVEYSLSLEAINETEIFALIATGENPEHLEGICNTAASVVCEKIPEIVVGSSCKVVDYAKPAQLAGTN